MKKSLLLICIALLSVAFVSCDSKGRLAKNIEGTWASNPLKLDMPDASSATMIDIFEFMVNPGENGGSLNLSGMVSVTTPLSEGNGIVAPISSSASGIISVKGTWVATDDDEIIVSLDTQTLDVQVDPDAVVLTYNVLSQEDRPDLSALKPAVAQQIKQQITIAAGSRIAALHKIDDIKIQNNMLSCEIGKKDLTLRRQTAD